MFKDGATTSYTYNAGNQLVSLYSALSTRYFFYDDNGNLISETNGTNTATYTWDYENRLTAINHPLYTIDNVYDGFGRRIQTVEDEVTTNYLYDGGLPIIEKDPTNNTIATYTRGLSYGGGIGGIISAKRGENNYYYHYNGMGSVTALTDSASSVVGAYSYDAYGNTLSSTGSVPNPFGFSTKEFSANSGLVYFGARSYNPQTGRWLNPDPLGMINGPNMYAYCNNNPVNLIDPWGLETGGGAGGDGSSTNTSGGQIPGKCPDDQTPTNVDPTALDELNKLINDFRDFYANQKRQKQSTWGPWDNIRDFYTGNFRKTNRSCTDWQTATLNWLQRQQLNHWAYQKVDLGIHQFVVLYDKTGWYKNDVWIIDPWLLGGIVTGEP